MEVIEVIQWPPKWRSTLNNHYNTCWVSFLGFRGCRIRIWGHIEFYMSLEVIQEPRTSIILAYIFSGNIFDILIYQYVCKNAGYVCQDKLKHPTSSPKWTLFNICMSKYWFMCAKVSSGDKYNAQWLKKVRMWQNDIYQLTFSAHYISESKIYLWILPNCFSRNY